MTDVADQAIKQIDEQNALIQDEAEVKEIIISQLKLKTIPKTVQDKLNKFTNIFLIAFYECELASLQNLPQVKHLIKLDLSQNDIPPSELAHLKIYSELQILSLDKNSQIKTADDLKPLLDIKSLEELELEGTELQKNNKEYRKQVFDLIPHLECIDSYDRDGQPVSEPSYDEENDSYNFGEEDDDDDIDEDEDDDDDDVEGDEGDSDDEGESEGENDIENLQKKAKK